jgi:peptide-methionine (R)-S-oxide reductase
MSPPRRIAEGVNMQRIDRRSFVGLTGAVVVSGALLFGRSGGAAPAMRFTVNHTPAEWRKLLGPQRYAVLREAATEHPFTSPLLNEHRRGIFVCAGCALPLFNSATKFDSGTGWPSFWNVLPKAVVTRADHSLMMDRTEVLCERCGGHLGHVFDDGPKPTGLRYCMNGLALNFRAA